MEDTAAQIARIRTKLPQAQAADRKLEVFGADSHRYHLDAPVSERKVRAFEEQYGLELPADYRLFVTKVGNGGRSRGKSAAGPFYGIYPLGAEVNEIIEDPAEYLRRPSMLFPGMSKEHWEVLTAPLEDDGIGDDAYTTKRNELFQGLLPIGSQGCSYLTALVVSGTHKGRVVNVCLDLQQPWFAHETTFLDWYERWLDEIILGYLQPFGSLWFGSVLGGTDAELRAAYAAALDTKTRMECLRGLAKIPRVEAATVVFLETETDNPEVFLREQALRLLTQYSYFKAKDRLKAFFIRNPLWTLQTLHWYAKEHKADWQPEVRGLLQAGVTDENLFDFATYLLGGQPAEIQRLLTPYATHPNEEIRRQANYTLGKLSAPPATLPEPQVTGATVAQAARPTTSWGTAPYPSSTPPNWPQMADSPPATPSTGSVMAWLRGLWK